MLIEHASWEETKDHDIEAAKRYGKATIFFLPSQILITVIYINTSDKKM